MSAKLERTVSIVLASSLAAMAAVLIHREFFSNPRSHDVSGIPAPPPPEFVAEWRDLLSVGVAVGDTRPGIKIIEFGDLQCPACRRFHEVLREVQISHGADFSLTLVHFPLSYHPDARQAARALECAAERGAASAFLDAVFRTQDSLGVKTWESYASDAEIGDLRGFVECASDTSTHARVEAGLAAGQRIGVQGTPTVLIDGWMYRIPPGAPLLRQVIDDLRVAKRNPRAAPRPAHSSKRHD